MPDKQPIKTLPWGEEIYLEIPLHRRHSDNKFYARHGRTGEGREYIEFSKFGPKPNSEGETYVQKLRMYAPDDWAEIQKTMELDLIPSIGWQVASREKDEELEELGE